MTHPLTLFRYCPRCGSPRFEVHDFKSKRCRDCGFTYYHNAAAATVAVIFDREGRLLVCRRAADPAQVRLDDTICRQVSGREEHLAQFAARFDAVLFVCGRKSSNGKVLFEVCRRANPRTYNIEEVAEIDPAWLEGAASVGICGATSTPRWLMQRVAEAVEALGRS